MSINLAFDFNKFFVIPISFIGISKVLAKSFVVPKGINDNETSSFFSIRAVTTSFKVPSPPHTKIKSFSWL